MDREIDGCGAMLNAAPYGGPHQKSEHVKN